MPRVKVGHSQCRGVTLFNAEFPDERDDALACDESEAFRRFKYVPRYDLDWKERLQVKTNALQDERKSASPGK
jgi:hypothetical protein